MTRKTNICTQRKTAKAGFLKKQKEGRASAVHSANKAQKLTAQSNKNCWLQFTRVVAVYR